MVMEVIMRVRFASLIFVGLALSVSSCNFPTSEGNAEATALMSTVIAMQTEAAVPQFTSTPIGTAAPMATETSVPLPPTPRSPSITRDTLCWVGPGAVYEVVSALQGGSTVELLGRGSIAGWWIVRNPIYKDPCWVRASDIQIDPAYDVSALQIYYPPPTPTFTPSITPSPTSTPTP